MPRAFLKAREPFSSYSHFVGAVLSGVGLFAMLMRLLFDDAVTGQIAAAAVVFCLSLIALYSASSIYHFSRRGEGRAPAAEKARPQHDLCADRRAAIRPSCCGTCPRRAATCSSP